MPTFTFTSPDGKSYKVTAPEGATQDQAWRILQGQLGPQPTQGPEAGRSWIENLARGVGEGVVGDIVGAGQLASEAARFNPLIPNARVDPVADLKREFPAVASAARAVKEWAMRPTASTAERLGRIGGGALPAMFVPELGLGRIAQAAMESGVAAGLEPTQTGTASSHLTAAGEGALAGGALRGAGAGLNAAAPYFGRVARHVAATAPTAAIEGAATHLGMPYYYAFTGWPLYSAFLRSPLTRLAQRWGESGARGAGRAAQAPVIPPLLGAAVGQQGSQ